MIINTVLIQYVPNGKLTATDLWRKKKPNWPVNIMVRKTTRGPIVRRQTPQ